MGEVLRSPEGAEKVLVIVYVTLRIKKEIVFLCVLCASAVK